MHRACPPAPRLVGARRAWAALFVALAAGCHRPPPAPPAVARVDGEPIASADLRAELARVRAEADDRTDPDPATFGALRRAVLEQLVERRILLAEARRQAIAVTDKEIDEALARMQSGRLPAGEVDPEAPANVPPEEGDAAADAGPGSGATPLRERVRAQLLVDKLLLKEVVGRVALGPDEAQEYYKAHPDEFRRGEQVHVLQIVVPRREDAEVLRRDLVRGGDFAKIARAHSTSPDARDGGDLGFFERGRMPPEFDEACFKLGRGQVSDVVKTDYGFHLFKLLERRDAGTVPFPKVEAALELKLRREAVGKAQAAYLEKVREHARIEIDEPELEKIAP